MKPYRLASISWAVGLVLIGVLLLLFNFGLLLDFQTIAEFVLAGLLAVAGVVAFVSYAAQRTHWWRLILAWTLLAVAGTVLITHYRPEERGLIAATLLIGITIAFLHVYWVARNENWWSLVLAGNLFVVGVVLASGGRSEETPFLASLLLAGFGLVFFLLYLVSDKRAFFWALIPGSALLTVALVTLTADLSPTNPLLRSWPLLLVVAGIFLGWRGAQVLPAEKISVSIAPKMRNARDVYKDEPRSANLGDYTQPSPGATIDVLSDPER